MIITLYPPRTTKPLAFPEQVDDQIAPGVSVIRNVSVPTLEVFQPDSERANGTAVVVVPGGGFLCLAYDHEGIDVARQLVNEGVTAFVLKYRVAETSPEPDKAMEKMGEMLASISSRNDKGEVPRFATEDLAVDDAIQAMRIIRSRADEWNIDPKRVGFLGFSAGSYISLNLAIGEPDTRPDFVGLIYGGLRSPIPEDAPPAFIAVAADDQIPGLTSDAISLFQAWKSVDCPAELHIYESGDHGFGMTTQGTTSDHWLSQFVSWMKVRGL